LNDIWKQPIAGYDVWRDAGDCVFHEDIAERVCKFFEANFKHSTGELAGQSFKLEDWQRQILGHLFAWKRTDGTRRFRKLFLYVPRKNGKTTFGAGMGLIVFVADDEPGAQIFSCAADTDQANIIFREASNMVRQNPALDDAIKILEGYKAMKFEQTQSYWKVLSSEAGTKHGLNPQAYIIDELHAQKNRELMDVMETGTGARRQPLAIEISTADYAGDSPCNERVNYARKVLSGEIKDSSFFPVLYEARVNIDDWNDEAVWRRVNPNIGVSLKLEYLRAQYRKAKAEPSYENTFKRLHLNMQTEQEKRWLIMDDWDASGQKMEKSELIGKKCHGALDLSSVSDISSFTLYFPEYCACLCWFWVPKKTAEKKIEYELWKQQGYIYICGENVVDQDAIRAEIVKQREIYDIKNIGFDPWNAANISNKMATDDEFEMLAFRQGFQSMNEPSKELEKMIMQHKLIHFGNPVLRWMASNANIKGDDSGNIKPVKPQKDSPLKIDGIVTLVMGVGLAMNDKKEDESIYEQRGLLVL